MSIISLPNGKTLISPQITKEGDFYQVKDGIIFSLWDHEGNMIYESDSYLDDVEKYIIFAKRADEDPKWKSYVNVLKENVIKDFINNEKSGNDYLNIRKLTVAKDQIGDDNLNAIINAYPIDKRVKLIEEVYGKR